MNDTNNNNTNTNNTDTKDNTMEPNTLLTGLQELFTNAVKAEVEKHGGTQETDMDDVKRMVEGEFSEWFNNCMSEFDITDHVDVEDLVQSAVNNIDLDDAICDTLNNCDYPSTSTVEEMIENSESNGMSLYDANEMLKQVARGGDCSEGDDFRAAVMSIVTAMQANTGGSVDDGTAMSVKVTGTEREIQAILQRRRSYFESLHSALNALMGSAPNGATPPPHGSNNTPADEWRQEQASKMIVPDLTVVNTRLWLVAQASTELLGLLSGLYHGETGEHSVRIAHQWMEVLNDYKRKVEESTTATSDAPEA